MNELVATNVIASGPPERLTDQNTDHVAVDVNDLEVCVIASNSSKSAPEKSVNNVLQV